METKKTYLVTGATGFVGSAVIKKLMKQGEKVIGFARDPHKTHDVFGDAVPEMVYGDIRNVKDLERLCYADGEKILIHTAAVVTIGERKLDKILFEVNVGGTANVIQVCLENQVKRLIHVSSVHAIPEKGTKGTQLVEVDNFDPKLIVGQYGKSKAMGSALVLKAVKEQGLDAVIVHPSGIIGPDDFSNTHMTDTLLSFMQGHIPASIKGIYDYVDVRDVADGIISAVDKGRKGECYLLTGGRYSLNEIFDEVAKYTGQKVPKCVPMWLARLGVPFLAVYFHAHHKRPLYTNYALYTLKSNSDFCYDKAAKELGYAPRTLNESIGDTYKDFVARGLLKSKNKKK